MDRPLRLDAYLDQPAGGAAVVAKALDAITWSADAVNNRLTKFLDAFREARTKLQTTAEDAGQLPQSEQTAATIALLTSLQNRFAEWQTKHDIEGGFKPIGDMVSVVKNDLPISGFKDKLEQLSDQLEVDIPQLPAAERGPAMDKVIKQVKHQLQQFDEKAQQLSAQIGAASRDCSGLWNDTNLLRADLRDVFRKIAVTIQQYRDVIIPGLREQLQTTEQEIAATQDRIRRFESEINDNRDKRDGPAGWLGIGGMVFESTGIPGFTDLGKEMQKPDRNLADANRQLEEQKHKANVTLKEEQDRQQEVGSRYNQCSPCYNLSTDAWTVLHSCCACRDTVKCQPFPPIIINFSQPGTEFIYFEAACQLHCILVLAAADANFGAIAAAGHQGCSSCREGSPECNIPATKHW